MLLAKLFVIFWDIPRHQSENIIISTLLTTILNKLSTDIPIDLHDLGVKLHVSAKITLCLKVTATVTFPVGPPPILDLQSSYSLNQMTKIIESLSDGDSNKLSPAWVQFIQSLDIVTSNTQKISKVHKSAIQFYGALTRIITASATCSGHLGSGIICTQGR